MPPKISKIKILILLTLFFLPQLASATITMQKPKLQIAIPGLNFEDVVCEDLKNCQINWISKYIYSIYKYAIGVSGLLAAIVLMFGGVLWLTAGGNTGQVTEAKSWIGASLTGLLIALGSYSILYIVNPSITSLGTVNISGIQKAEGGKDDYAYYDKKSDEAGSVVNCNNAGLANGVMCSNNTVNFGGAKPETVAKINQISQDCGCTIYVTSVTDGEHADGQYSHKNGYKFDLRALSAMDDYVKNNSNIVGAGIRSDGAVMYKDTRDNSCLAREGNHWDVKVAGKGCP